MQQVLKTAGVRTELNCLPDFKSLKSENLILFLYPLHRNFVLLKVILIGTG